MTPSPSPSSCSPPASSLLLAEVLLPTHGILGVAGRGRRSSAASWSCFRIDQCARARRRWSRWSSRRRSRWTLWVKVWPKTPVGKRLILGRRSRRSGRRRAGRVSVGQIGVAVSELRPSGVCEFGDDRRRGPRRARHDPRRAGRVEGRRRRRPAARRCGPCEIARSELDRSQSTIGTAEPRHDTSLHTRLGPSHDTSTRGLADPVTIGVLDRAADRHPDRHRDPVAVHRPVHPRLVSGASVSMLDLIGMSLRKVNPRRHRQRPHPGRPRRAGRHHAGDGERTSSPAATCVRVINAMIAANKANIDLPWKTATAIDLAGRDILDAVQTSVNPKVIDVPNPALGRQTIDAVAKDGIQLKVKARVTVRTNIKQPRRRRDRGDDHRPRRRGHRHRDRLGRRLQGRAGEPRPHLQGRAAQGPRRQHGVRDPLDRHRRHRRRREHRRQAPGRPGRVRQAPLPGRGREAPRDGHRAGAGEHRQGRREPRAGRAGRGGDPQGDGRRVPQRQPRRHGLLQAAKRAGRHDHARGDRGRPTGRRANWSNPPCPCCSPTSSPTPTTREARLRGHRRDHLGDRRTGIAAKKKQKDREEQAAHRENWERIEQEMRSAAAALSTLSQPGQVPPPPPPRARVRRRCHAQP